VTKLTRSNSRWVRWDPERYDRFKQERSQPFFDLVAKIPEIDAKTIADLGCGDGELTTTLLPRWPEATIVGVDSSEEMLAKAKARRAPPSIRFELGDLRTFRPKKKLDLVVSNSALQWLPDHAGLLADLRGMLAPAGVLAVQIPNNQKEAAYRVIDEVTSAPHLQGRVPPDLRPAVESPAFYEERLAALGLKAEVWETVYEHHMPSADGIVEWLEGTSLRPLLTVLSEAEARELFTALRTRMRAAYPAGPQGVIFPFRRLFFVATRG